MTTCGHPECMQLLADRAAYELAEANYDPDVLDANLANMVFDLMRMEFKAGNKFGRAEWFKLMNFAWTIRDLAISTLVRLRRGKDETGESKGSDLARNRMAPPV